MLVPGTLINGRWEIVDLIGAGGTSQVYKAREHNLGRFVAIKHLNSHDPEALALFNREALILADVNHHFLVGVLDYFENTQGAFLVMDYIDGLDLGQLLQRNGGPFSWRQVVRWGDMVLQALEYLHNRPFPIIHRDIKPQNLKFDQHRSSIIVLDFGLAKGYSSDKHTEFGLSVRGFTKKYAPLEQYHNKGTTAASDLYSLGATLYHLLVGVAPTPSIERVNEHVDPLVPAHVANPAVPQPISDVIQYALALRAPDRPQSAAQFRHLLRDAAESLPAEPAVSEAFSFVAAPKAEPATEPSPVPQPWLLKQRLRLGIIIGALLAVAFVYSLLSRLASLQMILSISIVIAGAALIAIIRELTRQQAAPRVLGHHQSEVSCLAFAANGKILYSAGPDRVIRGWDVASGTSIRELPGHAARPHVLLVSDDGNLVCSAANEPAIRVWTMATNTSQVLRMNRGLICDMAVSWPNHLLASADDKAICVYQLPEGRHIDTLSDRGICRVVFAPGKQILATGHEDGRIALWMVGQQQPIHRFPGHTSQVCDLAFNHDGTELVSASSDGTMAVWDIARLKQRDSVNFHHALNGMALHPKGNVIAARANNGKVWLWKPGRNHEPQLLKGHTSYVSAMVFDRQGAVLITVGYDQHMYQWDVGTGKPIHHPINGTAKFTTLAYTSASTMLAAGAMDGSVQILKI